MPFCRCGRSFATNRWNSPCPTARPQKTGKCLRLAPRPPVRYATWPTAQMHSERAAFFPGSSDLSSYFPPWDFSPSGKSLQALPSPTKCLQASRLQKILAWWGWAGFQAWRLAWAVSVCCGDEAEMIESLGQAWGQREKKHIIPDGLGLLPSFQNQWGHQHHRPPDRIL